MKHSTVFDIIPPAEYRQKIIKSIRNYRAVCRKVFTACSMAEMAGASIKKTDNDISIRPNGQAAKSILAEAFGWDGKCHLYQCRQWVLEENPSWYSGVWDALRRDVSSRWRAPDTQHTKARRGWLVLQGARSIGQFRKIGIAIPRLRLPKDALHKHKISLVWDHDIGQVEFNLNQLDGGRYYVWKCLRDKTKGWGIGTSYLNERDGRLFLVISYDCPDKKEPLDKGRIMNVCINTDIQNAITISGPDKFESDYISAEEAVSWLSWINVRRQKHETSRSAVGSKRKPWGSSRLWNGVQSRITRLTVTRENGIKTRNHLWTRRIVDCAKRWRCGTVNICDLPEREAWGHPWSWSQFKNFLQYKISEIGGKTEFISKLKEKVA